MAAYDLEEQEQIAELKAWWKQHGNRVLNVATVVALVVIAWNVWTWYQRNQASGASMVYSVLQQAVQDKDTQRIKAASGELIEKFGRTTYAPLGTLISAKVMVETGDTQTAKAQLAWAAEHAKNELRDLARLRLATVLIDEKAYDEALKQLEGAVGSAFDVRFQNTRGDIFSAQGKKVEALAAYRSALSKMDELEKSDKSASASQGWESQSNAIFRELILQKIDAVDGGQ